MRSRMRSRSPPRQAPARWSRSAASISSNSRSCSSPTKPLAECAPHLLCRHGGAGRCARRPRAAREGRSPSTGPTPSASTAAWSAAGGSPGRRRPTRTSRRDWLVFGAMIRTVATGADEPGLRPLAAALEEEGFDDLGSGRLVESFARHLMVALDAWQEGGFAAVAKSYLQWLPPRKRRASRHRRQRRSADAPHGQDRGRAAPLAASARGAAWLDPDDSEPGRGHEAAAHHPARSVRHVRVRPRGRAGRMGGVGRLRVLRTPIPPASRARRAPPSAPAFSASSRSAGRRWCRSWRRARATARRGRQRWRSSWSSTSARRSRRAHARPPRRRSRSRHRSATIRPSTLIAVHRAVEDGEIRETFRTLRPREGAEQPLRAFAFLRGRGRGGAGRGRSISSPSASARKRGTRRAHVNDFWLSCGHHLLDRDAGGGLVVDRRIPQGLSRAARARAAAGGLRGRAHAARGAARRSAPAARGRRDRGASPTRMRARTGR